MFVRGWWPGRSRDKGQVPPVQEMQALGTAERPEKT